MHAQVSTLVCMYARCGGSARLHRLTFVHVCADWRVSMSACACPVEEDKAVAAIKELLILLLLL
jgi:hypothetical protein